MRVAVVDIGTNSTRLLVADVTPDGGFTELDRRTTVTRLGHGVDASGSLDPAAIDRVLDTLSVYRRSIDEHEATETMAVLTSAVRDATNGSEFAARVRDEFGLDAQTLTGDEEAQLTFLGATSSRDEEAPTPIVVIDIGGGSTEFVVGERGRVAFHVSTQAGSVRQGERFVHHDPPEREELASLAEEVRGIFRGAVPAEQRGTVVAGVAVAGTATQLAAIDQGLEPYDPERVHGYRLDEGACERILAQLAQLSAAERGEVPGLDPARAPTIIVGTLLMLEAMRAFGLETVEVSEHDILRGAALRRAGVA